MTVYVPVRVRRSIMNMHEVMEVAFMTLCLFVSATHCRSIMPLHCTSPLRSIQSTRTCQPFRGTPLLPAFPPSPSQGLQAATYGSSPQEEKHLQLQHIPSHRLANHEALLPASQGGSLSGGSGSRVNGRGGRRWGQYPEGSKIK